MTCTIKLHLSLMRKEKLLHDSARERWFDSLLRHLREIWNAKGVYEAFVYGSHGERAELRLHISLKSSKRKISSSRENPFKYILLKLMIQLIVRQFPLAVLLNNIQFNFTIERNFVKPNNFSGGGLSNPLTSFVCMHQLFNWMRSEKWSN